jgi:hypothetical protein
MNEPRARRQLGEFFRGLSRGEGGAIGCVEVLMASNVITDADRRFLSERVLPEEYAHKQVTEKWANRFGAVKSDAFGNLYMRDMGLTPHLKDSLRVPWALTLLRWGEEQALRSFPGFATRVRYWEPELAQDLEQIVAEEQHHVAFDHRLHAQWQKTSPAMAAVHENLYRQAKLIYPMALVHGTAQAFRAIRELVR